jgi:hypothetical protein
MTRMGRRQPKSQFSLAGCCETISLASARSTMFGDSAPTHKGLETLATEKQVRARAESINALSILQALYDGNPTLAAEIQSLIVDNDLCLSAIIALAIQFLKVLDFQAKRS